MTTGPSTAIVMLREVELLAPRQPEKLVRNGMLDPVRLRLDSGDTYTTPVPPADTLPEAWPSL